MPQSMISLIQAISEPINIFFCGFLLLFIVSKEW